MSLNVVEYPPSAVPGQGERVAVLVHGIMADHRCWRRVPSMLASLGYRVLAVDLPGHGESPRAVDYRPEALRDSLVATLRERLGDHRVDVLMGHSLGGRVVALAVAELQPRRAVYLDPAFSQPIELLARPGRWMIGRTVTTASTLAALRLFSHRDPADRELTIDMVRRWDRRSWAGLNARDALQMPTSAVVASLVIRPTGSMLVSGARARQLAERGFTVVTLSTRSHVLFRDDYPGFLTALEGWI